MVFSPPRTWLLSLDLVFPCTLTKNTDYDSAYTIISVKSDYYTMKPINPTDSYSESAGFSKPLGFILYSYNYDATFMSI
jgi:hypothetical protein